ncbi:MAG: potassium transporter TrkG [Candidatus Methanomethylophilaceae archaeon]|nr:TrkH family potassium uptake protein [Candidatus Methanomethylophilaceae archaeon]MDD3378657.1 potassium transporter TrkG [Candidatus Methanomethylophilaceae archaeon]MDY0223950.1 potassium transporter TrkG [Candidatus Methanomethylophilaceae archaeon]
MFETTRVGLQHLARWESSFVKILGMVEVGLGIMLLVPCIVAILYGESFLHFICLAPLLIVMGLFQFLCFKSNHTLQPVLGILMMSFAWLMAFIVSAVPFYLYGFSFADSVFEGVSGFTTTGASIVTDFNLPYSLLFWRSFIQWVGGISVVLIFMFLLPMMGIGGRAFLNNELAGSGNANFSMKMKSAALSYIYIYIMLTFAEMILLYISDVNVFESVCMTMSTISTGGMMVSSTSIMNYSMLVQGIVLVFMFLGGTNFYLHYRAIYKRDFKAYVRSQEFVWTFIWFAVTTAIISAIVIIGASSSISDFTPDSTGNTVWEVLFTVVSLGTTTGFAITDYTVWPVAVFGILAMVGIFGSMSGTPAGGIKIYRILLVKSYVMNGLYKMLHPNAVKDVKLDGVSIDNSSVTSAIVIVLLFLVTGFITVVFLLFSEPNMNFLNAIGLTVCTLGNAGMGFGDFGPFGNYAVLTDVTKLFLSFVMWLGRLEVFMAIMIFTRSFWKDVRLNMRKNDSVTFKGKNAMDTISHYHYGRK